IGTGIVDLTLSPQEIAAELVRLADHPLASGAEEVLGGRENEQHGGGNDREPPGDEKLTKIFMMLRQAPGGDFMHYKMPTIRRRLHRRMVLHKLEDLGQYVRFMQQNPSEVHGLYQDILIHVTRFFRDPESFNNLAEKVFPNFRDGRGDTDMPIRIWVP